MSPGRSTTIATICKWTESPEALEDDAVIAAIVSGPRGGILFTLVEWSERPAISIPWTRISSREEALALAAQVRRTSRQEGEFTCVALMMKFVSDLVVTTQPAQARRVVMDVSGDGIDNCDGEEATIANRDALVATGMTINGLPIHEGDPSRPVGGGAFRAPGRPFQPRTLTAEIKMLEPWYEKHVIGGAGAFLLPAYGYKDFPRAIRQKFTLEISGLPVAATRIARLSQRPHDFAVGRFGKSLQRLHPDRAAPGEMQGEQRHRRVIGEFADHDHVALSHGHVEMQYFAAELPGDRLGRSPAAAESS